MDTITIVEMAVALSNMFEYGFIVFGSLLFLWAVQIYIRHWIYVFWPENSFGFDISLSLADDLGYSPIFGFAPWFPLLTSLTAICGMGINLPGIIIILTAIPLCLIIEHYNGFQVLKKGLNKGFEALITTFVLIVLSPVLLTAFLTKKMYSLYKERNTSKNNIRP
jgi:hypothetical protein